MRIIVSSILFLSCVYTMQLYAAPPNAHNSNAKNAATTKKPPLTNQLQMLKQIKKQIKEKKYELEQLRKLLARIKNIGVRDAVGDVSAKGNRRFNSFARAKKELYSKIYTKKWRRTFYCNCPYSQVEKNRPGAPDWGPCKFKERKPKKKPKKAKKPKKKPSRAQKIEAEHIVPASVFCNNKVYYAQSHLCKKEGQAKGKPCRDCAPKYDKQFAMMNADLYNLYPAIGQVNGDRGNLAPAALTGPPSPYGACDVKIDRKKKRFQPPASVRGDVARGYLYMATVYKTRFKLTKKQRELFGTWDKADPVSTHECERAERIRKIQGNPNPIIQARCKAKKPPPTRRSPE